MSNKSIVLVSATTNMLYDIILTVPAEFKLPSYGDGLVHGKAVFLPLDDMAIHEVGDVVNKSVVAGYYEDMDEWLALIENLFADVVITPIDEVYKI